MASIITLFLMIFGDFKLIAEISAIDSSLTAIFVFAFSLTVNIINYISILVFYAFHKLANRDYNLLVS
jgi:hypothetical protein